MSLLQGAILRAFRDAVDNPEVRKPQKFKIRDMTPITYRWSRMITQLNIIAKVEEKTAMLEARRRIVDDKVREAEEELERCKKAANRAPQKKMPSRKKPTSVDEVRLE